MEVVVIKMPKLPKDINLITDKRQLQIMLLNVKTEEELKVLVKENPYSPFILKISYKYILPVRNYYVKHI